VCSTVPVPLETNSPRIRSRAVPGLESPGMRRGTPPPAPNFANVVRALERSGMRRAGIARAVGVSPSAVCRWITERSVPGYQVGASLLWLAGFDPPDLTKPRDTTQQGPDSES
jgi:hypothetical protein